MRKAMLCSARVFSWRMLGAGALIAASGCGGGLFQINTGALLAEMNSFGQGAGRWVVAAKFPFPTRAFVLRQPLVPGGDAWLALEPLGFAFTHAAQVDVYHGHMGYRLAVLHGVPNWVDPARPVDARQPPVWRFVGGASGERIYRAPDATFALVVAGPGTWIVEHCETLCEGVGVDDVNSLVAAGAPPTLPAPAGAVVTSLSTLHAWAPDLPFQVPYWFADRSDILGNSLMMYPPMQGGLLPVVLSVTYGHWSSAGREASDLQGRRASGALAGDPQALLGADPNPLIVEILHNLGSAQAQGSTLVMNSTVGGAGVARIGEWVWGAL